MILLIKSVIVGICAIIPGVSGSVIAVSLGIYEETIFILSSLERIKQNKKYLCIVSLGIIIGVYLTSFFLLFIIQNNDVIYFALLGIILSEIPFLAKKIKEKTGKNIELIPCLSAFLISIILSLLNNNSVVEASSIKYFIGGFLFSFGKVFPGVSSSFLLLCLGIYENIILIITNPFLIIEHYNLYIPFIIGCILGLYIFIMMIKYLIREKFRVIYSVIIGLMLSSTFVMLPRISMSGIVVFIISLYFSYNYKKTGY